MLTLATTLSATGTV